MRKQCCICGHKPIYIVSISLDPNLKLKNLNKFSSAEICLLLFLKYTWFPLNSLVNIDNLQLSKILMPASPLPSAVRNCSLSSILLVLEALLLLCSLLISVLILQAFMVISSLKAGNHTFEIFLSSIVPCT